jgi:hypothetical protein
MNIVFIDSSIHVARTIREQPMRAKIDFWLAGYRLKATSSVALQEFKRRVLKDLAYLLVKLDQTGSYQRTLDYVTSVLPSLQQRKKAICLPILHQLIQPPASDEELTERTRLYLRSLVVNGENDFAQSFDSVLNSIDCYWAKYPIREKKRYKEYDFGGNKCSKTKNLCRVKTSLEGMTTKLKSLLDFLNGLPTNRRTNELESARTFLDGILNQDGIKNVHDDDPCLKFGDLLIALESKDIPVFYTMNYRESQAYCDVQGQELAIRPNDPVKNEDVHSQGSKPWPNP